MKYSNTEEIDIANLIVNVWCVHVFVRYLCGEEYSICCIH